MYFLKPQKIDELIIHLLLKGEASTTLLLSEVRKVKKSLTKQGFYAALRKLKKEDIVITYKKKASLNTTWLKDMRDKFNLTEAVYTSKDTSSDFLSLEDKESVTYNFSTIRNMDTFWGHTWNILTGTIANTEPLFIYDTHYWFYIARAALERKFQKEITGNKRQYLMTVGGKTALDRIIKKDFNNKYLQYNQEPLFGDNYYVTIIGDYIAEAHLDGQASAKIAAIFKTATAITPEVTAKLQEILEMRVKSKLKISRNKARAAKLKKRLGKNFYIIRSA